MDLLFSKYASPMEFMRFYIEQGRFGEFVEEILGIEYKRKQEEAKKEDDNKLWIAYLMSMSQESFNDWKAGLQQKKEPESYSMTNEQVDAVKQQAKGILAKISPK